MDPAVLLHRTVALAGRFPALSGLDLEVDPGEVVALVGPNGAGKTSVLRLCAGLLTVAGGEVRVMGRDLVADPSAARRLVGLLGHASSLYDELNPVENLRFAVRAAGGGAQGIDEALTRVGLGGRLRRTQVGRLSEGQRRRVSLAVLVARRPAVWLLDEPHAGLDAGARQLLDELIAEAAAAGAAVLVASHELDRVVPLADRVVSMAGGRVVAEVRGGRIRDVPAGTSPADDQQVSVPEREPAAEPDGVSEGVSESVSEGVSEGVSEPRAVATGVSHVA